MSAPRWLDDHSLFPPFWSSSQFRVFATKESAPTPELDQVHAQLLQVDKVLQREMAKEAQMDQLMTRLTLVHQYLDGMMGWMRVVQG